MALIEFYENAQSTLSAAITAVATSIPIQPADYHKFVAGAESGNYYYAKLRDKSRYEIVKINPYGSSKYSLSVIRAQEGTSRIAWPINTLIYQELTADTYEEFIQRGARTYAGDPNGIVSAKYLGENLYDSDHTAWWKSTSVSGTTWVLTGGSLWTQHLNNTEWQAFFQGVWDVDHWDSEPEIS